MIHVFHGFLGSAEDFNYLASEDVILHDLYNMKSLPDVSPGDTLIGYSMGGRIALEIAERVQYNIKKLVLINAHPGLASLEERTDRTAFEAKVIEELKSRTKEDFLEWWNSLPIFNFDSPISTSDERFAKSAELFFRYRLSQQDNHLPGMIQHKDKVLYIVGLFDEKYMELVSEFLIPEDIVIKGIPGGHRLFQNVNEMKNILIAEGIL